MKALSIILLGSTFLASCSSAFYLSFYDEDNCAGEELGMWIGGPNQGCWTQFAGQDLGQASGVTVSSTGPIDDNTIVVFYSSTDCDPGNAVAEADNGCLSINDFAATSRSWNVIPNTEDKRRRRGRSLVDRLQDRTSSAAPIMPYEHGQVATYANKTYKWHQVAQGALRGINPEDWDDNIHIKNDQVLEYPSDVSKRVIQTGVSLRQLSELDDRAFLYQTCRAATRCLISVAAGAQFCIGTGYLAFLRQATTLMAMENKGTRMWNFLNQPFVVGVTAVGAGVGSAYYSGVISAITSGGFSASTCSTSKADVDAIQSLIQAVATANPERAFQASLTYNGIVATLSMEAVPTGQRGDGNTCGAPATDPTIGPPT